MADTLTHTPAALTGTIRHVGGAFTPFDVRAASGRSQTATRQLTVTGSPAFGGTAALSKVGGASWLTIPATCTDGVAFTVTLDASQLKARNYSETIRASKSGYDDADCVVTLAVRPEGYPPKG